MTEQNKNQVNDIVSDLNTRLQDAIEKGNARRVIIRKQDGDSLVNVTLTTAVIVGAIGMIFLTELTMLVLIVAIVAGIYFKAKLELVSVVDDNVTADLEDSTPDVVMTSNTDDDSDKQSVA